jgi:hypothetical protein
MDVSIYCAYLWDQKIHQPEKNGGSRKHLLVKAKRHNRAFA